MVKGLDAFKRHFADYSDCYILIGGSAGDVNFSAAAWKTMDFDNLNALADKDLIFEHSRRRRMTTPIGFTKDGETEAKRLIAIVSKALDEMKR